MVLRNFFLYNLRWKLTALVLAILVWSGIRFAMYRGATGGRSQVLRHMPVMVVRAPDDGRTYRIDPSHVDIIFQSSKILGTGDFEAFVNLTTMPDESNSGLKQVVVRAPDATRVRVEPPFILVERVSPADVSVQNSLRPQ